MKPSTALCIASLVALAACDGGGADEQPDEPAAYAPPADPGTSASGEPRRDVPAASAQPGAAARSTSAGAAEGPATAEARIEPTEGNEARGIVRFGATDGTVTIAGTIRGLEPGPHGLHVHENGDCSAPDASSAGGHFDPHGDPHGSPRDDEDSHHVGDLGNITAAADGEAEVGLEDTEMRLTGPESVIGRALVVHAGRDDFETQPAGDSGARAGCGVIRETR